MIENIFHGSNCAVDGVFLPLNPSLQISSGDSCAGCSVSCTQGTGYHGHTWIYALL